MAITSIPAFTTALDPPAVIQQTTNPSSPDYVSPLPPQPGPPPARLPDIAYQPSTSGADAAATAVPDSATSHQLTAVRSALLTLEPDSVAPLTSAPQPLQQPGPIQPTLVLTI